VLADLGDKGASEVVAGLAPGARVVKAFNSIMPRFNEGPLKKGEIDPTYVDVAVRRWQAYARSLQSLLGQATPSRRSGRDPPNQRT
jgi:hypothetical protein